MSCCLYVYCLKMFVHSFFPKNIKNHIIRFFFALFIFLFLFGNHYWILFTFDITNLSLTCTLFCYPWSSTSISVLTQCIFLYFLFCSFSNLVFTMAEASGLPFLPGYRIEVKPVRYPLPCYVFICVTFVWFFLCFEEASMRVDILCLEAIWRGILTFPPR